MGGKQVKFINKAFIFIFISLVLSITSAVSSAICGKPDAPFICAAIVFICDALFAYIMMSVIIAASLTRTRALGFVYSLVCAGILCITKAVGIAYMLHGYTSSAAAALFPTLLVNSVIDVLLFLLRFLLLAVLLVFTAKSAKKYFLSCVCGCALMILPSFVYYAHDALEFLAMYSGDIRGSDIIAIAQDFASLIASGIIGAIVLYVVTGVLKKVN